MKEIKLKRKQIRSIEEALHKADRAKEQGTPGSVLAQIWRDENTGEVFADVEFIENERAGQIFVVINGKEPPARYNWKGKKQ